MIKNKINQSQLEYSCGAGSASVNLATGRVLFLRNDISIGANTHALSVTHIYSSDANELLPFETSNERRNWKLSVQQCLVGLKNGVKITNWSASTVADSFIYYDGAGFSHNFIKFDGNSSAYRYYDDSGLSLVLQVDCDESVISFTISDEQDNKLCFDCLGRLTSIVAAYSGSIQQFIYNNDNLLDKIYCSQNTQRYLKFDYSAAGELKSISAVENGYKRKSINYFYEGDNLIRIQEYAKGIYKDVAYFSYETCADNNLLNLAVCAEDKSALKIQYVSSCVSKVFTGFAELAPCFAESGPLRLGEHACGDGLYSQAAENHVTGNKVSAFIHEKYSEFEYNSGFTDIVTQEALKYRYFLNENGFTTSAFEVVGVNNYRTLFKEGGVSLYNAGVTPLEAINGDYGCNLADGVQLPLSAGNFNVLRARDGYNIRFNLTFFIKCNAAAESELIAAVEYSESGNVDENVSDEYPYDVTETKTVFLDKSAKGVWQYVSVPLQLHTNKKVMWVNLKLSGVSGSAEIADVRVAVCPQREELCIGAFKSVITDDIGIIDGYLRLSDIKSIIYNQGDVSNTSDIGYNFFVTEQDIKSTFNSMRKSTGNFDFIHNGGTGRISGVNKIFFKNEKIDYNYPFEVEKNYGANYYLEKAAGIFYLGHSSNDLMRTKRYFVYGANGITQRTEMQKREKTSQAWDKGSSAAMTMVTDYFGNLISETDEYGVKTEYSYDDRGNVVNRKIFYENNPSDFLAEDFSYDSNREVVIRSRRGGSYAGNDLVYGITTQYGYTDVFKNLNSSEVYNNDLKMAADIVEYDDLENRVTGVSAVLNGTIIDGNKFTFSNGRVKTMRNKKSPGSWYSFDYDDLGRINKFSTEQRECAKTLKTKEFTKQASSAVITEKIYHSDNVFDTIVTKHDVYGKPLSISSGEKTVQFSYQTNDVAEQNAGAFRESSSLKKISEIQDGFSGAKYKYYYDYDNQPTGFEQCEGDNVKFRVQQMFSDQTKYQIDSEKFKAEIVYDENKLFAPRVVTTKNYIDCDGNAKDEFDEIYFTTQNYEYNDMLGRLTKKSGNYSKGADNTVKSTYNWNYRNGSGQITPYLQSLAYYSMDKTMVSDKASKQSVNNLSFSYAYNTNGNINHIIQSGSSVTHLVSTGNEIAPFSDTVWYEYNNLDKLTREVNGGLGTDKSYFYNDEQRLKSIKNTSTGEVLRTFNYDGFGKLIAENDNTPHKKSYVYDNYGNRVGEYLGNSDTAEASYAYTRGNLLAHVNCGQGNFNYEYNYAGQRVKKEKSGSAGYTVNYYYDGGKLLFEENNGVWLRYFYDLTGLCGVGVRRPDGTITDYTYVKDGLGNVVWIMKGGEVIAWYKYDAWGKCEIVKDADGIGTLNPFRWKSYYCDNETGFYYINGRYYDPETMQYLDADDIENIIMTGKLTGGLDRNAITLDNTIGYRANEYNIYPVTELYADPRYDPKAGYSWWDRNKKWFFRVLLIGVGLALSLITGGMYGVFCATLYGVNAAITGALIGGAIGGIAAAVTGGSFWTGFVDGAINGIIDGFASGVFLYGALSTISAVAAKIQAAGAAKVKPSVESADTIRCTEAAKCFKAGTLIETEDGYKKIEEIEVGDKVLSYNEETREREYKKVTRLFRNGSAMIRTPDGKQQPLNPGVDHFIKVGVTSDNDTHFISATDEHPWYVLNASSETPIVRFEGRDEADKVGQWVASKDLKIGNKCLLSSGETAIISSVEVEYYNELQNFYNIEVEGAHTYYVGEQGVLVHNACETNLYRAMSNEEYGSLTKHGKFSTKNSAMADKWMATTYDDAVTWGNKMMGQGNFRVVEIRVPTSSLSKMYYGGPLLDGIGPAYSAHYKYLNEIMLGFGRVL